MRVGAQHMRMLDPMQARRPQTPPMTPGVPEAKPIIEKMELAQRQADRALSESRDVLIHVRDRRGLTGIRARGRAAHKTKQEMTKHLALLASLGMLGLSEHMIPVDLRWQEPTWGDRAVTEWAAQTNKVDSRRSGIDLRGAV